MDWQPHDTAAFERLERLKDCDTFSTFCRDFYRLIHRRIVSLKVPHEDLSTLFTDFLDIQVSYHEGLQHKGISDNNFETRIADALPILARRLAEVRQFLKQLDVPEEQSAEVLIPLRLMRAECYYQMNQTGRVIEELEAAIARGCADALVQFALGYNVYAAALEAYAHFDAKRKVYFVQEYDRFQEACRRAARSFEQGLTGTNFDAQLFWWLGLVLEAAGDHRRARAAYRQVAMMAHHPFQEEARRRLSHLHPSAPEVASPEEQSRLAHLPAIGDQEAKHLLEGVETVSDLLDRLQD